MMKTASRLHLTPLEDFWKRRRDRSPNESAYQWTQDRTLLDGLRLNLLETSRYLASTQPSFEEFESWILERNGGSFDEPSLDRLRRALAGETVGSEIAIDGVEGLSREDLIHWEEHGYVVVRNAVSTEMAEAAELALYKHLGMNRDDPESWYGDALGHSIWVPLLRHPAMQANRRSPRIAKAFAQLWGKEDLWATVDQSGFNPPERPGWLFPGPHLHWDTTLAEPHHFGVQGILYLADVEEDQGAFCCVPGFHRRLKDWLDRLPPGANAREIALATLTMKPIAAKRGDMVLWHQSLPHGSSPNRAKRPRVVQYISMHPARWPHHGTWR